MEEVRALFAGGAAGEGALGPMEDNDPDMGEVDVEYYFYLFVCSSDVLPQDCSNGGDLFFLFLISIIIALLIIHRICRSGRGGGGGGGRARRPNGGRACVTRAYETARRRANDDFLEIGDGRVQATF